MRKKTPILLATLLVNMTSMAQTNYEIFMMGQQNTQGSARSMALGGASASLGGDFTGVVDNPATLGVYRTGQFGMTMGLNIDDTKSTVQSQDYLDQRVRFVFNQFYFIGTNVRSAEKKNISSLSWGIGMNRVNNFNNRYSYYRENNQNNFGDVLSHEYNTGTNQTRPWYAWDVAVLDTLNSNMQTSYNQDGKAVGQNQVVEYTGSLTELNLSGAYNYQNKMMYGIGIGIPMGSIGRTATYTENDATGTIANFNWYNYHESFRTNIIGFNAKLGLLYQPQPHIRLGGFYQTPTAYSMDDTFYYNFASDMEGYAGLSPGVQSADYIGEYSYNMRAASKYGVSATYLFDTKGLVTFDYLRQNPQNNKMIFSGDDQMLESEINKSLASTFVGTNTFKLGLEARMKSAYLRIGGNYTTSPYRGGGSYMGENYGFSLGIAGRSRSTAFDLTYVNQTFKTTDEPYYSGIPSLEASVRSRMHSIVFSLGFR